VSLRDQLVAKGLASKKDARRVTQELRENRKQVQATRRPQSEIDAEQRALAHAAAEAAQRRRAAERKSREQEREAAELSTRIRQIVRVNAVRSRGPFRFYHRTVDGTHLHRLEMSERVAFKLRCGEAAIAALVDGPEPEYLVVSQRAAQKLAEIAPHLVVHYTTSTAGLSDAAEMLYRPESAISLVPHRVRDPG
jgi:hypothetical protein